MDTNDTNRGNSGRGGDSTGSLAVVLCLIAGLVIGYVAGVQAYPRELGGWNWLWCTLGGGFAGWVVGVIIVNSA
ncbi:MAG TPA: hypothetical protein VGG64_28440 [Pirellulales bacterium]|jgi:hypothetical protein